MLADLPAFASPLLSKYWYFLSNWQRVSYLVRTLELSLILKGAGYVRDEAKIELILSVAFSVK
ncbi:hypothetical protein [Chromohalobacter canadensis]|uniref:hypothetical protein n=1 Tax=Chromohalobacter canadensis TaxID=141389 RepID=UPI0024105251|nr:hypothetical protein [Chromohalobacter canadensis]